MDRSRLEAFSDGVFAVAITLLALNLIVARPGRHDTLLHQLGTHWPVFVAYLISFFIIGIVWVNHHVLVRSITAVDRMLLFLNLVLLLFVVLIPFATATLAEYLRAGGSDSHVAAALYAFVSLGMGLAFAMMFLWSSRHGHFRTALDPSTRRHAFVRFSIGNLAYLLAIGLAFVSAWLTLVIVALVAIYYSFEQLAVAN